MGFEFEPKDPNRKGRPQRGGTPLRVLGPHPRDKAPVELHAGRYGPYVKHRDVNATLPDKDKVATLTLEEAVALIDEKSGKAPARKPTKSKGAKRPRVKAPESAGDDAVEPPARRRATPRATAGAAPPAAAPRTKAPRTAARRVASPRAAAPEPAAAATPKTARRGTATAAAVRKPAATAAKRTGAVKRTRAK